jgi:hypothetical protein
MWRGSGIGFYVGGCIIAVQADWPCLSPWRHSLTIRMMVTDQHGGLGPV